MYQSVSPEQRLGQDVSVFKPLYLESWTRGVVALLELGFARYSFFFFFFSNKPNAILVSRPMFDITHLAVT